MAISAISAQPAGLGTVAAGAQAQHSQGAPQTSAAQATPSNPTSSSAQTAKPAASYSVSISTEARAALIEATETSVQTAQEARRGDIQAQHLLAKENAQKAALGS